MLIHTGWNQPAFDSCLINAIGAGSIHFYIEIERPCAALDFK
jgi:hypothetical protein